MPAQLTETPLPHRKRRPNPPPRIEQYFLDRTLDETDARDHGATPGETRLHFVNTLLNDRHKPMLQHLGDQILRRAGERQWPKARCPRAIFLAVRPRLLKNSENMLHVKRHQPLRTHRHNAEHSVQACDAAPMPNMSGRRGPSCCLPFASPCPRTRRW